MPAILKAGRLGLGYDEADAQRRRVEALLDEILADSFPASDPPCFPCDLAATGSAGTDRPHRRGGFRKPHFRRRP